jgi:hypothetical protein
VGLGVMKPKAIVCDIHNTVLIPDKNDKPINNVIDFLKEHASTHKIIMMTSSPEKLRAEVTKDLRDLSIPFDEIVMNKLDEDSDDYKYDAVKSLMDKYDVTLFIDNKKENRKAIKKLGILTKKPENIKNNILTKTIWSGIFI